VPRAFFANQFKIPTLWGVKDTAPYFHDNGARTLRNAVAHYQRFYFTDGGRPGRFAVPGRFHRADRQRR
jgi:cytochrome c peroxidase